MKWYRYVGSGAFGIAVGSFLSGVYLHNPTRLTIAFVYLGLAWIYREMNLGWDVENDRWKPLPWRQVPETAKKVERG